MTLENITKSIRILDLEGTKTVEIPVEYLVELVNEVETLKAYNKVWVKNYTDATKKLDCVIAQGLSQKPCAKKFDEVV